MSEKLNIKDRATKPAIHFAFAALVKASKNDQEKIHERPSDGTLEIEFKINGVDVPFIETIEEIYRRYDDDLNRRAAEIAFSTAQLEGLNNIRELVDVFDWKIREKLEEVFGVKLD